eukprot:980209-Rhodomonas_salina.5
MLRMMVWSHHTPRQHARRHQTSLTRPDVRSCANFRRDLQHTVPQHLACSSCVWLRPVGHPPASASTTEGDRPAGGGARSTDTKARRRRSGNGL